MPNEYTGFLRKGENLYVHSQNQNVKSYLFWNNSAAVLSISYNKTYKNAEKSYDFHGISQTMLEIRQHSFNINFTDETYIELWTLPSERCSQFSFYGITSQYLNYRFSFQKSSLKDFCIFHPFQYPGQMNVKIDVSNFVSGANVFTSSFKPSDSSLCGKTKCSFKISEPYFLIFSVPYNTDIHVQLSNFLNNTNVKNYSFGLVSILDSLSEITVPKPSLHYLKTNNVHPNIDINIAKYSCYSYILSAVFIIFLICLLTDCCKPGLCYHPQFSSQTDILDIVVSDTEEDSKAKKDSEEEDYGKGIISHEEEEEIDDKENLVLHNV